MVCSSKTKACRIYLHHIQKYDVTYKLLELGLPVYIHMIEDGNGQSEVVVTALLVSEDSVTMHWLMETFNSQNLESEGINVVMADKEREQINLFLICLNFFISVTSSRLKNPSSLHKRNFLQISLRNC